MMDCCRCASVGDGEPSMEMDGQMWDTSSYLQTARLQHCWYGSLHAAHV